MYALDTLPVPHITACREQHHAFHLARVRAKTEEFKTLYACHAQVEGTISQGVRAMGYPVPSTSDKKRRIFNTWLPLLP